jgi:hypothetical protein
VRETLDEAHDRARQAEKRMACHPVMKTVAAPAKDAVCGFCRIGRCDLCPWNRKCGKSDS